MSPARLFVRNCRGNSLRKSLRTGVSGTLIAAYVVVAAGIPLPTINRPAKSGERFPCESSSCGCDSAEHCWQSCCCHTLAERLAWAEKNGVKPPAFVLAEAQRAGLDSSGRVPTTKAVKIVRAAPSCCQSKQACCESSVTTRSCCCSHHKSQAKNNASNFVLAWRALGCRGQSLNWLAAVPTLITVELNLSDQLPLVAWLGPHSSAVAGGVALVPTPPPPERA